MKNFRALLTLILLGAGLISSSWAYEIRRLHPFEESTVAELAHFLGPPVRRIYLAALQNDWAHRAIALIPSAHEKQAVLRLAWESSPEFAPHVRLRVVGFVHQTPYGWIMDPIFDHPERIHSEWRKWIRNLENIRQFPLVTATNEDPVVIWITVETRGLRPGRYEGNLIIQRADGKIASEQKIPIFLRVQPVALPVDNPLYCWAWQWIPKDPTQYEAARLFYDYGINTTHLDKDMEICQQAGFRFFVFVFEPSWKGQAPEEVPAADVDKRLREIQQMIAKLRLRPEQWALYIFDEPSDKTTPQLVKWAEHIRQKWPQARFLFNPVWGPGPRNEWGSVEGTIKPFMPYANIWIPYSHWLWDDVASLSVPLMKQAEQCWLYEIVNFPYTRQPKSGRCLLRLLPWLAWKYGLQGACFYSLNAISQIPYMDDPKGKEYAASYYGVPARSLEALREGFQEYKRMLLLRQLGAEEAMLQKFTERALRPQNVRDYDNLRQEMDERLVRHASRKK